jgi:hypothetical protein
VHHVQQNYQLPITKTVTKLPTPVVAAALCRRASLNVAIALILTIDMTNPAWLISGRWAT